MLDENLPTFYIKSSSDNSLSSTIYLSQNASELQPEYTLRRPDPNLPASKNCYAVALIDPYNPEVLFAEVLVQPDWTQPTLSAAEVRAQNGVPPPPVPIIPNNFVIQLYNPDQQVTVRQIPGSWNSSAHWEFEMPQNTFRMPSVSALDRSQSDPAVSDTTPKIAFKWKRDGKLSKDMSCTLSGKSTEGRKNKEPDITVAMFKGGKNLTIYEPNMHRVDVEDLKGLEVVFILSAAVIKDIYFNANREMFNISSPNMAPNTRRRSSGPAIAGRLSASPPGMSGTSASVPPQPPRQNIPPSQIPQQNFRPQQQQSIPSANPRSQWEIDAETARLQALVDAEEKERARAEREEEKRIKKMLEKEEKEQRRRQAEIDKETERLRKKYGVTGQDLGPRISFTAHPTLPPRPQNQHLRQESLHPYQSAPHSQPAPVPRPLSTPGFAPGATYYPQTNRWIQGPPVGPQPNSSPYLHAPGNGTASSSGFYGSGGKKISKKKSSIW